jgi:asparagine synthase (glutamine-hydrolysing)
LAPSGGKVIAFTAVPRDGYEGPDPQHRIGNEGPLAAATAAMYPNVEHVLIRSGHVSPLEGLDRTFFLYERPILNMCNAVWGQAINQAARERKLSIMLFGQMGNSTISYHGLQLLPELLRSGRLIKLVRESAKLVAKSNMHWRGALKTTLSPFLPVWLWQRTHGVLLGYERDVLQYSAIRAERLADFDLAAIARRRHHDFSFPPAKDGFSLRLKVLGREDSANHGKAALAGWGIDRRDPTADKRLVEYCLSVPTEQYLADGVPRALVKRALSDRLPRAVLDERRKGYQAVDWHEGLTAAHSEVATELDRLSSCRPAAKMLDLDRLKALVKNWPKSRWERGDIMRPYRLALLRGIGAGFFLRKASGANE